MSSTRVDTMTERADLDADAAKRMATLKRQITKALAESRRARHHRDCHCRMFDRQWCNAADALWQRSINRQLEQLFEETTP